MSTPDPLSESDARKFEPLSSACAAKRHTFRLPELRLQLMIFVHIDVENMIYK